MQSMIWCRYVKGEVRIENLRNAELKVLFWLANSIGPDDTVSTNYAVIAHEIDVGRRHVVACVRRLMVEGIIEMKGLRGRMIRVWLKKGFTHSPASQARRVPADFLPAHVQPRLPTHKDDPLHAACE